MVEFELGHDYNKEDRQVNRSVTFCRFVVLCTLCIMIGCFIMMSRCARYEHQNPLEVDLDDKVFISGFVQKGPFYENAVIQYSVLNERLEPMQNISNIVLNNSGYFQIPYHPGSFFHQISVAGDWFNEVLGGKSSAPLKLSSLIKTGNNTQFNVNILTTFACERIRFLVLEKQQTFQQATAQAEKEVLSVFGIQASDYWHFNEMNIAEAGNQNAVLLACSLVLLGDGNENNCIQLIETISNDIKTDGMFNDSSATGCLIEHAKRLDLIKIRDQLNGYYKSLSVPFTIPAFEKYAQKLLPFHVVDVWPVPGGSNIPVEEKIMMTFNKMIDKAAIGSDLISIQSGGDKVSGEFFLNENDKKLIFTPASSLDYGSLYTISLEPGLTSSDSTFLQSLFTWSFHTQDAPLLNTLSDTIMITEPYHPSEFVIYNAGGDTLNWKLSCHSPWISLNTFNGFSVQNSETISIAVDTSGMEPGNYLRTIQINSNGGLDSILVHLLIPAHPLLAIEDTTSIDLGFHELATSIGICNLGTGTLLWQASADTEWLFLNPTSGTLMKNKETIHVSANRDLLSGGHHIGHVILTSNGGNDTIQVDLDENYKLFLQPDSVQGKDASVSNLPCSINPDIINVPCVNTNLGSQTQLYLESWTYDGYQGTYRSFLQFGLSQLHSESIIDSAILELYFVDKADRTHEGDNAFYIDRVTLPWEESTVTWTNQPSVSNETGLKDRILVNESIDKEQDYRIDLTDMVRFWHEHPLTNFGMCLSLKNESFYRRVIVGSSDSDTEDNRPKLTIYYRKPTQ